MAVAKKKLSQAVIKAQGNMTEAAKELGISRQAVAKRLTNNPDLKRSIQEQIEASLKKAGITSARVYKQLSSQLEAKTPQNDPDWNAQDKARKDCLELMGHLDRPKEGSEAGQPIVVMPLIMVDNVPLKFNIGTQDA